MHVSPAGLVALPPMPRDCANSMVLGGGGIRAFMPVSSSSLERLPSELLSIFVNSSLLSPRLVPVLLAMSLNMVLSSVWSTLPLLSVSTLTNIFAWCWARWALTAALAAVREGVRSVHIIDGGVGSALLLEVLTNSGIGTAMRSDAGPHFLADSRSYFAGAVDE